MNDISLSTISDGLGLSTLLTERTLTLATEYGLNFLAPVGIDTEAEPSASELAALIAHLKKTGAGALFVENITSPALIEQISKETGLKRAGRFRSVLS